MQDRNKYADIENGHVGTGEGEGKINWESSTAIYILYILPCVKQRASGKLPYSTGSSGMTCRAGMGRGGREAQDIQLIHFVVQQKANTIVEQYIPIKNKQTNKKPEQDTG